MGNYEDDLAAQISEFSDAAEERLLCDGQEVLDLLTAGGEPFDLSSFTRRVAQLRALICDEFCEDVPHAKLDVDDASEDARDARRARRQRERELNFWDKVWRAHNGCADAFAGLVVYPDAPVEFRITPKDHWDMASEKKNPALLLPGAKLEARQRIDAALERAAAYLLRLAEKRSTMGTAKLVEPVAVPESTPPLAQRDQFVSGPKRRRRTVQEDPGVATNRQLARERWLEQQLSLKGWSSDLDIHANGGPVYNTVGSFRTGRLTTRNLYVRRLLATAFGCNIADVPE